MDGRGEDGTRRSRERRTGRWKQLAARGDGREVERWAAGDAGSCSAGEARAALSDRTRDYNSQSAPRGQRIERADHVGGSSG